MDGKEEMRMENTNNIYANYMDKREKSSHIDYNSKKVDSEKDIPVLAVFERLEKEEGIEKGKKKREKKKKRGVGVFLVFILCFITLFGMMQSPNLLYFFAEQLYNQERYAEAINLYDKAAVLGSKIGQEEYSIMSNRVIADYYYDTGKYEEAAKYYGRIIGQVETERMNDMASQYYNSEDYENAIKWYKFAENEEGVLNAQEKIASQYYENKEYDKAATYYEEIGDQDGYHKSVDAMAFSCYSEGKYEEAIEWYKKIEKTSGIHMAQIKLAEQCQEVGDYESAIQYYESAGEMDKSLEVKEFMADQYYENGNYERAKDLYDEILENELPFMTRLEIMMKSRRCKNK